MESWIKVSESTCGRKLPSFCTPLKVKENYSFINGHIDGCLWREIRSRSEIQAENISALEALLQSYQDETLQKNIECYFQGSQLTGTLAFVFHTTEYTYMFYICYRTSWQWEKTSVFVNTLYFREKYPIHLIWNRLRIITESNSFYNTNLGKSPISTGLESALTLWYAFLLRLFTYSIVQT